MNEDKATRYRRLRRRAVLLATVTWTALLAGLAGSETSRAVAEASAGLAQRVPAPEPVHFLLAVAGYAFVLALAGWMVVAPWRWYGEFVVERRFGRSRRRLASWLGEFAQATLLNLLVWTAGAVLLYAAIRWWPGWWWLAASLSFCGLTIALARLTPTLALSRRRHLRPLAASPLRRRLESLIRRAGLSHMDIQEWRTDAAFPQPNAVLVGVGPARRVLLTDALLADYSDDEIEVVLAHELGHCVHLDLWKTIACETAAVTLACGAAWWVLPRVAPPLGLTGAADIAGLPVVVLAAAGVLLLLRPVTNLISRGCERRADRFAVEMTGNPGALASGLRRLAEQTLAEERPSAVVEWLFHSHPPLAARLGTAREFADAGTR